VATDTFLISSPAAAVHLLFHYHLIPQERNEPSDTTWNKILEEVQRRRKESNDLREEAIGVYGRQRYLEQQRQREKVCTECVGVCLNV
jgi:hypothetical protein